jgi:hypothetical protein
MSPSSDDVMQAQRIINIALDHPGNEAPLIAEAGDDLLREVLAMSHVHGTRADGLRRAIDFEQKRRAVMAQLSALEVASTAQVSALQAVERSTRDAIEVTKRLGSQASRLTMVGIMVMVASAVAAIVQCQK